MGFRRGFSLGFLLGAAAAALLTRTRRADAPEGQTEEGGRGPIEPLRDAIGLVRKRAEEALAAAHEAADSTESDMRRHFREMTGKET